MSTLASGILFQFTLWKNNGREWKIRISNVLTIFARSLRGCSHYRKCVIHQSAAEGISLNVSRQRANLQFSARCPVLWTGIVPENSRVSEKRILQPVIIIRFRTGVRTVTVPLGSKHPRLSDVRIIEMDFGSVVDFYDFNRKIQNSGLPDVRCVLTTGKIFLKMEIWKFADPAEGERRERFSGLSDGILRRTAPGIGSESHGGIIIRRIEIPEIQKFHLLSL